MGIIEDNLHPKVLKNQLFIKAVDWLIDTKAVDSQKDLAAITKIQEPTLSNIRNDKKVVSDGTIRKLLDAFPGVFNMEYFRGHSIYMTTEELISCTPRPDDNEHPQQQINLPDYSSLLNAAISAKDETISSYQQQLASKDELVQTLQNQLADKDMIISSKDEHIATLKRRIAELHDELNKRIGQDITGYPFTIGVSEDQQSAQK